MTVAVADRTRPRLLGVYAHPDDETFCTGGTFAKYASRGCEIMVVSATRGQAGQIRSGHIATRKTIGHVREQELNLACRRLGVEHVICWDYQDGTLQELNRLELEERITRVLRSFRPDLVFTFANDGGYGHPDHIAISEATTVACVNSGDPLYFAEQRTSGLQPFGPRLLYQATFPRRHLLLRDRLVKWLIDEGPDFKGDPEFVYALLLLAEEASSLHCVEDHHDLKWFPSGVSIVEQGEPATTLFLLLAGHADVVREEDDGTRRFVTRLEPGQFFGEQGIASQRPRNAHVVAAEPATCLVLSPSQPTLFEGRGEGARLVSTGSSVPTDVNVAAATTCIDVGDFIRPKLDAIAAYRSQLPIRPGMLPLAIFRELFGAEYFARHLPAPELETELGIAYSSCAAPS